MKKFKILSLVLSVCMAAACIACFGACAPKDEHEHTFATAWSSDENSHWHAATCEHSDLVADKAAHKFDENGKCTVCGYQREPEPGTQTCGVACPVCGKCIDVFCEEDEDKCGDGLVSHEFEAEKGILIPGTEGIDESIIGKPVVRSDFAPDLIIVGNLSRNVPSAVKFVIDADKDMTVTLRARVSKNNDYVYTTGGLNIIVNGTQIERDTYIDFPDGWRIFEWLNFGCIELKSGENVIEFVSHDTDDPLSGSNLDKIELLTAADAVLTWEETDNPIDIA